MRIINKSLSSEISPRQVDKAWDMYVNSGVLLENSIRSVIGDSWARCLEEGVDPSSVQTRSMVDDAVYKTLINKNSQLIEAAKPVMEQARDSLAESGSMMILADRDGICLHVEGDRKTVEDGHDIHLCKRANWSENAAGTNAIGTVLSVGKPVQINTTEHFCEGIKSWTCTAMVIRDPGTQDVVGVLDLSGLSSVFNHHAQALVVEAASRIESRLIRLKLEETNRLLNAAVTTFSSPTRDALMLLDKNGCLVKANEHVASNLAMRGVKFNGKGQSIIRYINNDLKMSKTEWLRSEWIEPVMEGQDQLGSMIIIPSPHSINITPKASLQKDTNSFEDIIGSSSILQKAIKKAQRLAVLPVPILIQGETGVGKEIFAKAIHAASSNCKGPLITLNCGGLSRELITSELFGYVEGAFTGASRGGKMGKIEAAAGGTLFLDEIGEMPLDIQANFLRVLQEGEICRLGEHKQRKVDFRVLVATNRDLNHDVKEGRFRMDLFYRISVITLNIPALRERKNDIEELVHIFADHIAKRDGVSPKKFDTGFIKALKAHEWPGNIRELHNTIECSYLMCQADMLTVEDLSDEFVSMPCKDSQSASLKDALSSNDNLSLEDAERIIIASALKTNKGNLTKAARQLGIAKSTLYLKLEKYGLDRNLAVTS
jgi:transcriptional regulator of acetoin/glycerol metabolism